MKERFFMFFLIAFCFFNFRGVSYASEMVASTSDATISDAVIAEDIVDEDGEILDGEVFDDLTVENDIEIESDDVAIIATESDSEIATNEISLNKKSHKKVVVLPEATPSVPEIEDTDVATPNNATQAEAEEIEIPSTPANATPADAKEVEMPEAPASPADAIATPAKADKKTSSPSRTSSSSNHGSSKASTTFVDVPDRNRGELEVVPEETKIPTFSSGYNPLPQMGDAKTPFTTYAMIFTALCLLGVEGMLTVRIFNGR